MADDTVSGIADDTVSGIADAAVEAGPAGALGEIAPRTWPRSVGLGVAVWLATAAIVYVLVAMPLYFLSSLEPNGRDRPFVRDGLLVYGPLLAVTLGVGVGVAAAHWYRSGRTWPVRTADSPSGHR